MLPPGDFDRLGEITSLIDKYCNPDISITKKEGILGLVADHVKDGQLTISEGIKILGPYLNHATDDKIRRASYAVLHVILQNATIQGTLDDQKKLVNHLLRFVTDRFYDFDCLSTLIPCLYVCFERWHEMIATEQATHVMLQFFENVNIQSMASTSGVQSASSTRALCFQWFTLLITFYPEIVKTVNFLNGFIQSMDGERDPLNLIYCFETIPKILRLFDDSEASANILTGISDELFDVTSCYFPVTYTPPPNDTREITRDNIARALLHSFACNKYFAPTLFPFLLEKLSSDLLDTKIESLEYMCYCIEHYGVAVVEEYLTEIWSYIKAEVVKTSSLEVMKKCYESITRITRAVVLPKDPANKQFDIPNIEGILRTALLELKSKECKLAAQYSRMVYACGVASRKISLMVFNRVFPELIAVLSELDTYDKIYGSLLMVTQVLQSLAEMNGEKPIPEGVAKLIMQAHSLFLGICKEQLEKEDKEMVLVIIEAISRFVVFGIESPLLRDVYISRILLKSYGEDHKSFSLLHATSLEEYKDRVVKDISWINKYAPSIVQQDLALPLTKVLYEFGNNPEMIHRILGVLLSIGKVCPNLTSFITEKLFDRIDYLITNRSSFLENERRQIFETICGLAVETIASEKKIFYIQKIIDMANMEDERLSNQMVDEVVIVEENICTSLGCSHSHHKIVDSMSHLSLLLNRLLEVDQQQQIVDYVIQSDIVKKLQASPINIQFVSIFSSILVSCRPEVNTKSVVQIAPQLLNVALQPNTPYNVITSLSKIVASLLNKLPLDMEEFSFVISNCHDLVYEPLFKALSNNSIDVERNLEILSWLLKGLVMRGAYSPYSDRLSTILCSCLIHDFGDSKINKKAADCFLVAIGEDENSIHKLNHAVIQVLYKQRFFATNVRKLMDSISSVTQPHIIGSILLALSNLIHSVPTKIILSEVKNIFPIVLKYLEMRPSISSDDHGHTEELLYAAIKTTLTLLTDAKEEMAVHLSSVVPILLDIAKYPKSQTIRVLSIDALHELTVGFPYHEIFPHKKEIIKGLEICLDDKKRNVRKTAVKCRNSYYILSKAENK